MELKQIVKRAVRRWVGKIASKRAQRQARLALPSGSDLLKRKAEAYSTKDRTAATLERRLAAFAEARYDLRHNLLTGQAEFRPKGQDAAAFLPLTARDLNSLCLSAHEAGIPCWDRDVSRFVASDRLPDHHPFRDYFDRLPRIASFIATSNSHELLSDPSGSCRFLCVEVERPIDSTGIDHAQTYAQLKDMLLGGGRHWFTAGGRGGDPTCQRGFLPHLPCGRKHSPATSVPPVRVKRPCPFPSPSSSPCCASVIRARSRASGCRSSAAPSWPQAWNGGIRKRVTVTGSCRWRLPISKTCISAKRVK